MASAAMLPLVAVAIGAAVLVVLKARWGAPTFTLVVGILGLAPLAYTGLVGLGLVRETWARIGSPWALYPGAALVLFAAARLGRLAERMGRTRRSAVQWLSSSALLLGVLASADLEIGRPKDALTVLVLVDRSRSMDLVPSADARIAAELRAAEESMQKEDRIGVVAFAAEAKTEDPPRPKAKLSSAERVALGRDATDLETALRRAIAELPDDTAGRVVVLSDGVETRGDALAAAALAVTKEVPIDVLPLEQQKQANVRVVSVRAPTRADEHEPIDLRVVVDSSSATPLTLRVLRDGALVHTASANVRAGEDVLKIREVAEGPGLHRYDVEVSTPDSAADVSPDDNTAATFVRVRGVSIALVLEGDAGKAGPIVAALENAGFRVRAGGAEIAPLDVAGFAPYDLVVLSDIRANELSTFQLAALASYTRDLGGGLLLFGGDRSFGPGGYARTPVEDVSPVSFDLRQKQRRASLAEVIAIDYSGSMGMIVDGQTKLALANEAAARSASLLGPGDRLGVAHVDTAVSWTQPLDPVSDPNAIAERIRKVGVGGGGIYTDLALTSAYAAFDGQNVNLKHVLLFADGGDAEQIAGCRAIVKGAHDRGITTSVISLGEGSDTPELAELAKLGEGRFYLIDDATKLPQVFTQETVLASRSAIVEKPFVVSQVGGGASTRGLSFDTSPALRGYVVTATKPRAEVLLAGPEGDPILATWAVGLGRSAAFTSDYKARWGAGWLSYPTGAKLFGQLARDTARREEDPRVRLQAEATSGTLRLRADVVRDDGGSETFRHLRARISGPNGVLKDVALEASGPGRYEIDLPLARKGTYVTTLVDESTGAVVATSGAVLGEGQELTPTGTDHVLLGRIATVSSGRVRTSLAGLFADRGGRKVSHVKVAHWLAALTLVLLLGSVGARKLAVPEGLLRAISAATERRRVRMAAVENQREARADETRARAEAARKLVRKSARAEAPTLVLVPAPRPLPATTKTAGVEAKEAAPPGRTQSAAERIAERRRGRKE